MSSRRKGSSKSVRNGDQSHWLGHGSAGQETLFLHFDPYLYTADKLLAGHITRISRDSEAVDGKPTALLWLAEGLPIFWPLPLLARHYSVTIVSDDDDEILDAAVEYFDARQITSEETVKQSPSAQLLLFMSSCWESRNDFVSSVRNAVCCLEDSGEVVFVLPAWGESEDNLQVCWADGDYTDLSEIVSGNLFRLPAPATAKASALSEIALLPDLGARAFVEAHRLFWGNDISRGKGAVRGWEVISQQCYARLLEEDISPYFFDTHRDKRWVVVLSWGGDLSDQDY